MHRIRVNDDQAFACAADDTLLRAALRAGLGFPYECNAGACGSCKVQWIEGEAESLRPDAPGLPEAERARGRVLACQAQPRSDCAIRVRLRPENVPRHRPERFRARLAATRDLTHDMREFRFEAPASAGFLAGQYALFSLPGLDRPRTYSMANADDGSGAWHFVVRRVAGGSGTAALFDRVAVGAEVAIDGPYGLAYLRTESPRDLVCVAGGSGLAPILSIVRAAARDPALSARRIHVFHGVRAARDRCAEAELRALPGFGERIVLREVLSEPLPGDAWRGATGPVHEQARAFVGDAVATYEYYFAGPPAMAEAMQRMLIERRVPFPQVHFDRFY